MPYANHVPASIPDPFPVTHDVFVGHPWDHDVAEEEEEGEEGEELPLGVFHGEKGADEETDTEEGPVEQAPLVS